VNGFDVGRCVLVRHGQEAVTDWTEGEYTPGSLAHISFGGLNGSMYATMFIATKTEKSTHHKIPQQFAYRQEWSGPPPVRWAKRPFLYRLKKKLRRLKRRVGYAPFPLKKT
jgi:hypothetical protein